MTDIPTADFLRYFDFAVRPILERLAECERLLALLEPDHAFPGPPKRGPNPQRACAALSAQERKVADLLLQGMSNQQISRSLGISIHTVKNHVRQIFLKVGARSRTEAVVRLARMET